MENIKRHRPFGGQKPCANIACVNEFQPTTQNKTQMYCSRKCKTQVVLGRRPRTPHTEETKRLISANRQGKALGHVFWGSPDYFKKHAKELAEKRRKAYPIRACLDCSQGFQVQSKSPNQKFCSLPCANHYIGSRSALGERSKGRTPPEGSGRCKWYVYSSRIAGTVKVQGTWELRYAYCLDVLGKPWRTNHNKDRFQYEDELGNTKSYAPDFWVNGRYVEIKGFFDAAAQWKLGSIKAQGIDVEVLTWTELRALEILLFEKPLAGINTPASVTRRLCG